ncbi:MAG: carboxylating nicotinate-nucleotide diphosphorylase [Phycisphaeraceae bacterium]|nr:carboxylating nicotinate-nucleotide diphosphorylase [Phycisphaeraceae bacterium]
MPQTPFDDPGQLMLPVLRDAFQARCPDALLAPLMHLAMQEDLGDRGDVTTDSLPDSRRHVTMSIVMREPGVLSGLAMLPALATEYERRLGGSLRGTVRAQDGMSLEAGAVVAHLTAPLHLLLAIERPLLNFIGRLSGIATVTRRFVDRIRGTRAVICETRKTTPGLRGPEKHAVACGGGVPHRLGLFDAALYKDNHLAALPAASWAGSLSDAIRRVRAPAPLQFVEVEVDRLDQLEAILGAGPGLVDIVLLDNMPPPCLRAAVARRDARAPGIRLEASGGITLENVREVAETGVDRISVGALTHGIRSLDVGLDA